MPANGSKNLKRDFKKVLPKEKAAEMGRISGESRRKKKDMRETLKGLLDMKFYLVDEELARAVKYINKNTKVQDAILMGQIVKAITDKDTKAAEFVRDTSGQKPSDKHEIEGHISYEQTLKKVTGEEM